MQFSFTQSLSEFSRGRLHRRAPLPHNHICTRGPAPAADSRYGLRVRRRRACMCTIQNCGHDSTPTIPDFSPAPCHAPTRFSSRRCRQGCRPTRGQDQIRSITDQDHVLAGQRLQLLHDRLPLHVSMLPLWLGMNVRYCQRDAQHDRADINYRDGSHKGQTHRLCAPAE